MNKITIDIDLYDLLEQLEELCPICNGHGFLKTKRNANCEECKGTGRSLTIAGTKLLDFISKYRFQIRENN
jgi:DnaJ-class molecular chaperone